MKFRKYYYKVYIPKAWNETVNYLRNNLIPAIATSIVIFIMGIILDQALKQIINPILISFGSLLIAFLILFLIKSVRTHSQIYNEQQNIIESLKEQRVPKLQIRFNDNEHGYIYDEYADYGVNIGRQISERIFRVRVDNLSKTEAIEGVEVILTDIDKCVSGDKGKLPVHLKLRNDNPPYQNYFTIPIDGYKFFDVIQAFFDVGKRKMCDFVIRHIEKKDNYTEIPLQFNAEDIDYKIKIEVKSNTTLCEPKYFIVGVRKGLINMREA